ncbi:MAG: sigma-70 family RNA polymerase sigma factor [Bacteroidota bacterium]
MEKREAELFEKLKAGDESQINGLYHLYRNEFIHWCITNYSVDEEGAADLFQDTIIAFYFNVRNGILQELSSKLKTYIFAIGKNLALKKLRKEARMVANDDMVELNAAIQSIEIFEESDKKKAIAKLMTKIGEPCKSLLKLFYFDRFSMDAIATRLGYKNENVAKSQKLRCFNSLKKLALEHYDQDDL